MQRITEDQMAPVARLLAECFIDEPVTAYQINGISNGQDFLVNLFNMQLEIYSATKDVFVLDKRNSGVIIGSEKKNSKRFKQIVTSIRASSKLRRMSGKADYKTYTRNLTTVLKEVDLNWQKKYVDSNYYHLSIMAVASEHRGKGYASKLIAPIIALSKDKQIPLTLETANTDQIGLYEHWGFELVKTITGDKTGIHQYCFIRQTED